MGPAEEMTTVVSPTLLGRALATFFSRLATVEGLRQYSRRGLLFITLLFLGVSSIFSTAFLTAPMLQFSARMACVIFFSAAAGIFFYHVDSLSQQEFQAKALAPTSNDLTNDLFSFFCSSAFLKSLLAADWPKDILTVHIVLVTNNPTTQENILLSIGGVRKSQYKQAVEGRVARSLEVGGEEYRVLCRSARTKRPESIIYPNAAKHQFPTIVASPFLDSEGASTSGRSLSRDIVGILFLPIWYMKHSGEERIATVVLTSTKGLPSAGRDLKKYMKSMPKLTPTQRSPQNRMVANV